MAMAEKFTARVGIFDRYVGTEDTWMLRRVKELGDERRVRGRIVKIATQMNTIQSGDSG